MKTYKFKIEIFVYGETEDEAAQNLIGELDYLCGLDNTLQAYTHPAEAEESPTE